MCIIALFNMNINKLRNQWLFLFVVLSLLVRSDLIALRSECTLRRKAFDNHNIKREEVNHGGQGEGCHFQKQAK